MGIFSWIFGPKRHVEAKKRIWLRDDACLDGLITDISKAHGQQKILLVAHFLDELKLLHQSLVSHSVSVDVIDRQMSPNQLLSIFCASDRPDVTLVLGKFLQPPDEQPKEPVKEKVTTMVWGLYPLPHNDEQILDFVQSFGRGSTLDYYLSLDHPIMKLFSGDWIRDWLIRMGMSETEMIESRMVARRLEGAQQKIAKSAPTDHEAISAQAWLARNLPNS